MYNRCTIPILHHLQWNIVEIFRKVLTMSQKKTQLKYNSCTIKNLMSPPPLYVFCEL